MMSENLVDAMHWQAEFLLAHMHEKIDEIFPGLGSAELRITGFLLRPASDEDYSEADEAHRGYNDLMYVFEAHFLVESADVVGNLSNRLLLYFDDCDTYNKAVKRFIRQVDDLRNKQELDN